MKKIALLKILITLMLCICGCTSAKVFEKPKVENIEAVETKKPESIENVEDVKKVDNKTIILATTTSTNDSGLLDYLLPEFTKDTGYEVKVIAVGSGKAIQMGVDGEVDVLLVHARQDEEKFVAEGHGSKRYNVMYNDFVIVGDKSDPAAIKGLTVEEALKKMEQTQSTFLSRGDDSGTHKKELSIWKAANISPDGSWYVSTGKGMGEVLQMANEMQGYTLTDRATYLSMKDKLEVEIILEGDQNLLNPYGILPINPSKNESINAEGAEQFAKWFTSEKGQKMIGEFGIDKFGMPLFFPQA